LVVLLFDCKLDSAVILFWFMFNDITYSEQITPCQYLTTCSVLYNLCSTCLISSVMRQCPPCVLFSIRSNSRNNVDIVFLQGGDSSMKDSISEVQTYLILILITSICFNCANETITCQKKCLYSEILSAKHILPMVNIVYLCVARANGDTSSESKLARLFT